MATFYEYSIPILLLVFLIICFMAFLWVKQQRSSVQEPIVFKPTYSKPYKPIPPSPTTEAFQTGTGYVGPTPGGKSGTTDGGAMMKSLGGSLDGSEFASLYPSQFDLSVDLQLIYGEWEITPFDKYYDIYEENERKASLLLASKFNDIRPAPSVPPDFGSTLGAFDSDTTRIPWDNDNAAYKPADIVWGVVSEQASRSIFLKTYLSELAGNSASFIPCSPDQPANFCYKSPLFQVSVYDPVSARLLETADIGAQALVGIPPGILAIVDENNFSQVFKDRKAAIAKGLNSLTQRSSHALGNIKTAFTKLGSRLGLNVGARKIMDKLADLTNRQRIATKEVIENTVAKAKLGQEIVGGSLTLGAVAASARAAASLGTDVSASTAASYLATLAVTVDIFFGVFAGVMMGIEAILNPIIEALFNTGGLCPPGYESISNLVPEPVLTLLGALIPLVPFLQTFDPFVCWTTSGVKNGLAVLKIPPKVPPFLSDRTLSLIYHAAWQNPTNQTLPGPSDLTIMMDPLPSGYVWLEKSDLAKTPNVSFLSSWATRQASIGLGTETLSTIMKPSDSGKLPSNVAVKTCEANTTPSPDGQRCLQKKMPAGSIMPVLSTCPAGTTDDGYNCWNAIVDKRCIGGQIKYTTTTTWNDATGYFLLQPTPVCCKDATAGGTQDTTSCTDPNYTYRSAQNSDIAVGYMQRITCPDPDYSERESTELLCYGSCPAGFARLGAICKGTTESYNRQYMFGTSTIYKNQKMNTETMRTLADVTIPYCDFSSPAMLDKMAQFYYNNSQKNPQINGDGTIQVQAITVFHGVIASSELSCDVVCSIDFITYDPITGAKYSSYTGCSYEGDPIWENCAFCFRRFYFIRVGNEPKGEFTVTGCTFADYTAPEAMVQSNNMAANLVPSLPKKFDLVYKDNVSIVDLARFNAAWSSGQIMAQAGAGLAMAGISIALSVAGAKGGAKIAGMTARTATKNAVKEGAEIASKEFVLTGGKKLGEKQATALSKSVTKQLTAVPISSGDFVMFGKQVDQKASAIAVAQAQGMTKRSATAYVERMTELLEPVTLAQSRGGMVGGVTAGIGGGLFTSMYLNPLLEGTLAGALPPGDIDGTANTYVVGTTIDNLSVATNNNWWTVNHGFIYELATGYTPNTKFCESTVISTAHCSHKYVIRNMVNKYHNEFQRAHIKKIREIEPRGVNGCYYKWDEVEYDPMTNIEGSVLIEKEVILAHVISDYATCSFGPTSFITNVDNPAYPVRSYPDPSTKSLSTQRIIYPTRSDVYTSDLFARYVRVRPPLSSQQGGSKDGLVNLSQLAVFDVSGFNISVQMETYGTSVAEGAGTPDVAVNGTTSQSLSLSSVWQQDPSDTNPYWEVDLSGIKNIAELIYFGADFPEAAGRNIGVRIEFLYTNGANDTPITTYTLPNNESCQQINMYSSVISAPIYPVGGPIIIPRPIKPGTALALNLGCANKCEDRVVIDSLTQQYNDMSSDSTAILKVLRGITANSTTCEYEVEMIRTAVDAGSSTSAKNTITKEIVSMQVTPTVTKGFGNIMGRFIKISPSGVDGTVLEFSKIIIRNTKRGYFYSSGSGSSGSKAIGDYTKNEQYIASTGANVVTANMLFELQEAWVEHCPTQPGENCMDFLFTPPLNYKGDYKALEPESFPNVFRAKGNDTTTFFVIDLEQEYEIYDIAFVGCSDRTPGGIMGIKVEIFLDQARPTDAGSDVVIPAAYDGTYPPTYTYYLPTNDVNQLIVVEPPSQCTFTLSETDILAKPAYLQDNSAALSATDTSGGVFSFSSLVNSAQAAWKNFMGSSPTSIAPIEASLKQSDIIVNQMQDTIVKSKSILNSGKKCSDREILNLITGAYNAKGSPTDQDFFVVKHTMKRILKAGQSTPSTCDVLFEDVEENYDEYIVDITDPENKITSIKAARFGFVRSTNTSVPVVPDLGAITYDISANALGIMNESSVITPVYSGTNCAVDCANMTQIKVVANKLQNIIEETTINISSSVYPKVEYIFQSSPLSCEYAMKKITSKRSKITNITTSTELLDTYVKAFFAFDTDGCTPILSSVKEYDPEKVDYNSDFTVASINGVKVNLPSIYDYEPSSSGSYGSRYTSRVISSGQNIS